MTQGGLLLLAGAGLMVGLLCAFRCPRGWLASTLIGAAASFSAAVWMLGNGTTWDWQSGFVISGESLHLRLDAISAFFLVLLSVLGGAGTLYSSEYWSDKQHPASAPAGRRTSGVVIH